jgi:hypothetical protein
MSLTTLHNPGSVALVALLATIALSLTATGCGGAGSASTTGSRSGGYVKLDGDMDADDENPPAAVGADEQPLLSAYGGAASPADAHAIESLVKNYYAASLAGDAARACSMLYSNLASGLAAQQSQPVHGTPNACAGPMSVLLRQQRARLISEEISTMMVVGVRVKGNLGLAVLGFKKTPESEIVLEREGHTWKIDALVDTYMP